MAPRQPAVPADAAAHHVGSAVWVAEGGDGGETAIGGAPLRPKTPTRWVRGTVRAVTPAGLTVETEDGSVIEGAHPDACPLQNTRDDALDDLVRADFLHEPGCVCDFFSFGGSPPASTAAASRLAP
jgi:hypothetical protein